MFGEQSLTKIDTPKYVFSMTAKFKADAEGDRPTHPLSLLGLLAKKEKSMSDILGLNKTDVPRFIALAARFIELKDLEAARAAAEAAVACDEDSMSAVYGLGVVFALDREFSRAIACFERVKKVRPNDVSLWTNLGECYLSSLRYAEAADAFRIAMELDPNSELPSGRRARAIVARTLMKLQQEAIGTTIGASDER